ncbi:uncharacterized protein LOC144350665 [Saccoglossus kowalevskii]
MGMSAIIVKSSLYHIGTPIWCGAVFGLTGGIACLAAYRKNATTIKTCRVLCVLSLLCSFILSVVMMVAVTRDKKGGGKLLDSFILAVSVAEFVISVICFKICHRAIR